MSPEARPVPTETAASTRLDAAFVFTLLRRRGPVICLCLILGAVPAYLLSKGEAKKFTATASLVFNGDQLSQQVAGIQAVANSNAQSQQDTNLRLVELGDTAKRTATTLGHGLTTREVTDAIAVAPQGDTSIVNVSATATSPTLAADIANTYCAEFVTNNANSYRQYVSSALSVVNQQLKSLSRAQRAGPVGLALLGRQQSLETLAGLPNGNVQLAQAAAVPTAPSAPKVARNTVLGLVLGLVIGAALAVLLQRLDRKIRVPAELEASYGLPLLGVVPESSALSTARRRRPSGRDHPTPRDIEAFRLIRAHLRYFNVDKKLQALMVVSALPGEGKTTVARYLGAAAAEMSGGRALILEADLRRATLANQLGVRSGPGLADVLIGAVSVTDAIQSRRWRLPRRQRGC